MISTAGWLSAAVENTWDLVVGIVVFLSINTVITPPIVSIPNDNGVTSSNNTSLTSPAITPPWIAAPIDTTSSGLTDLFGSFPNNFLTDSWTAGIRVEPPTNNTWWISVGSIPASFNAWRTGVSVLKTKSRVNSSNFALVNVNSKCKGPAAPAEMNGNEICVCIVPDKSFLAFSAASLTRCIAILSFDKSTPWSFLNSSTTQFMIFSSKSSPPSLLSPAVANTSKVPSAKSKIETSNVPPPKSYTNTFCSWSNLSNPNAKAAAVGSLIIRSTSKPAILPASLVAWRCASLKYAGTVITACVTVSPKYASAVAFKFCKIIAEISCGV